jgi:hypothetical protein
MGQFPEPTRPWDRLALAVAHWEICEGIPVASAVWSHSTPEIREKLQSALRLIAHHAPGQFERIGRLMRGVIVARLYEADATWRNDIAICLLDVSFLESNRASGAAVAATIIHELTHARLNRLGCRYTSGRRARIEHICHLAELRFLSMLPESKERAAAIEAAQWSLRLEPSVWSDEAIRARKESAPWYIGALRFVFRPLPAIND